MIAPQEKFTQLYGKGKGKEAGGVKGTVLFSVSPQSNSFSTPKRRILERILGGKRAAGAKKKRVVLLIFAPFFTDFWVNEKFRPKTFRLVQEI